MLQTPRHLENVTEIVGSWISMRLTSHLLSHMSLLKHLWYWQLPPHTVVTNIVYQWDDLCVGCQDDQNLCRLDDDKKQTMIKNKTKLDYDEIALQKDRRGMLLSLSGENKLLLAVLEN